MSAIVLRNGRVGLDGPVGDVVVDGGVITGIGFPSVVMDGDAVDLRGATVLPGLWDSHVHSVQWALAR